MKEAVCRGCYLKHVFHGARWVICSYISWPYPTNPHPGIVLREPLRSFSPVYLSRDKGDHVFFYSQLEAWGNHPPFLCGILE
ncbi:hypothetical protein CDL15_Pgr004581 [Punica granatum]|uniref:Uncharacterized protein n=1 Tax=Punica granatum TaxID=22663 RepID=A0A218WPP6_PUNGR|nr:hypothetical protein CDL15_Pgr004581 [Punica granatum]